MSKQPILDPDEKIESGTGAGCGMLLYVMLLLTICLLGFAGMGLATWTLIQGASQVNPRELTSGTEVGAWRLQPMRDAGLLASDELPAAFHDESADFSGSVACAMTADAILRVDRESSQKLPFDAMEDAIGTVTPHGEVVSLLAREASGHPHITCLFGEDEGGTRFLRQIQVELMQRAQENRAQ